MAEPRKDLWTGTGKGMWVGTEPKSTVQIRNESSAMEAAGKLVVYMRLASIAGEPELAEKLRQRAGLTAIEVIGLEESSGQRGRLDPAILGRLTLVRR